MSRAYDNAADGRYQQGGRRNLIINGNFDVWQRGTTFNTATVSDHYSADRWKYYNYDGDIEEESLKEVCNYDGYLAAYAGEKDRDRKQQYHNCRKR